MAIPLKYNIGNLMSRKVSTVMTVLGIGIVIAVMVAMMALYNGVQQALVSSGSKENLMVLREGAQTEATSWVTRDKFRIISSLPGIEKGSDGRPMVSPELVVIFKLPRYDNPTGSQVNVRGVTPKSFELRPHIRMIEGRMFRSGVKEVVVSDRMRQRFVNMNIGESFRSGTHTWTVVGVYDAEGTSFDSEIWADVNTLGDTQKRPEYSSLLLKPAGAAAARQVADAISTDTRLKLQTKTEYKYYEEQTSGLLGIRILVTIVTFFMVLGAILGAMNTMFSAVASRKRELATMRALGFKRRDVLLSIDDQVDQVLGGLLGQRVPSGAPQIGHEAEPGVGNVADQRSGRVLGVDAVHPDLALAFLDHVLAVDFDDARLARVAVKPVVQRGARRGEHAREMLLAALADDDGGAFGHVGARAAGVVPVMVGLNQVLDRLARIALLRRLDRPLRESLVVRRIEHDQVLVHLHDHAVGAGSLRHADAGRDIDQLGLRHGARIPAHLVGIQQVAPVTAADHPLIGNVAHCARTATARAPCGISNRLAASAGLGVT